MFQNLLGNIPKITKNLLIINVLFFIASFVYQAKFNTPLSHYFGLHYIDSPFFKPFQLVTHFFMHADMMHIFFNMFGLVIMGSHLERYWGEKRYLIFYLITAFGAAILHNLVQGIELYSLTGSFLPSVNNLVAINGDMIESFSSEVTQSELRKIGGILVTPTVGASGAIYGLIMAFALLFPNTQFMLLFPPIPIKAKWMAVGLALFALYNGFQNSAGDSIAHFAHLGGMLFGFILVKIWGRDRQNFY